MTRLRWAALAILVACGLFAWFGGQFSTGAYRELVASEAATRDSLRTLRHQIDSLKAFADSIAHDPWVQERYAREKFGMLRPGELIFTIDQGDSTRPDSLER